MSDLVAGAPGWDAISLHSLLPPPVAELPARLVSGALILPSRDALVALLPKRRVVVEVGVALGNFTRYALDVAVPVRFIAIDWFRLHELEGFWGRTSAEHFGAQTHAAWYRSQFAKDIATGVMEVMEGESVAMLERLDDASVDIFYLDATHLYENVREELAVVVRKIKPDGYIIVDDYTLVDQLQAVQPLGVMYAANEFMIEHNWALHYIALQTNTYYQAVLRRADLLAPATVLQRENAALREDLAAIRSSTSWYISAPVRWFGRLVGRPGRR